MDKFDLAALRVSQDLEPATRPDFGFLHLGRPNPMVFIRTFLVPERTEAYWLVRDADKELYIVTPTLAIELGSDAYPACLVPYVTRDPAAGIWPVKVGKPGGKRNSWNESAYEAALTAQENWVRVESHMAMGCYGTKVAIGPFGEPLLPGDSYGELVLRVFDGGYSSQSGIL